MKKRVSRHLYIVDDEPGVCGVLSRALERAGMTVCCFSDAAECLARLDAEACDLLITDVRLPGKSGIELLKEVRRRQPWIPVLVMTGFGDVPMATEVMKAGAADFLEKPLDRDAVLELIRTLVARHAAPGAPLNRPLTAMEAKILQHLLDGRSNRKIADILHRSPRTVEVHRRHLMRKMGANNVVELLQRAAQFRLPAPAVPRPGPTPRATEA